MKRKPHRLSAEELAKLMEELNGLEARPHFLFTGGEPTLHPQLFELLETVDGAGYSTYLMTNGTRMRKETAERLSKMSHLIRVQVSLESTDPKINDSIYGKGLHRRVLKTLDILREQGVPVALAVTPMKDNEEGLPGIEEFASAKGADVKYISLYNLGAAQDNGLKPAKQSSNEKGNLAQNLMCEKGVAYSEGAFYPCPVLVKATDTPSLYPLPLRRFSNEAQTPPALCRRTGQINGGIERLRSQAPFPLHRRGADPTSATL